MKIALTTPFRLNGSIARISLSASMHRSKTDKE